MNKKGQEEAIIIIGVIVMLLGIASLFFIFPIYNVWAQEKSGQASLAEAEWSKQIAIEEAKAEKDSASLKAESDIIRAGGIAEANRIIASSLTDKYITWKWVEGLQDGSSEVIYVPTEANLPILEARTQ